MNLKLSTTSNISLPEIPSEWDKQYKIVDLFYVSDHCRIYTMEDLNKHSSKILKIAEAASSLKKMLKALSHISDTHLLLPEKYCLYNNLYYIVYPYKLPLLKKIHETGICKEDIITLSFNICDALETLHSADILHLDITPSNIYYSEDGTFCLGDFSSSVFIPFDTHLNNLNLTEGYIPPELFNNQPLTISSDLYMLMVTISVLSNNGVFSHNSININNSISSHKNIENLIHELNIDADYKLKITDKTHPLFYLKTKPFCRNYAVNKPKAGKSSHSRQKWIYTLFIAFSAALMIKACYRYMLSRASAPPAYPLSTLEPDSSTYPQTTSTSDTSKSESDSSAYSPTASTSDASASEPDSSAPETTPPLPTELDISNKNFTSIPNKYLTNRYTSSVKCIYAYSCNLKMLDNITSFTQLTELYISENHITDIASLECLTNLNTLIISYNKLTDIKPLKKCRNLSVLDLSGNNSIKNLTSLTSLKSLSILNLTDTNSSKEDINTLKKSLPQCNIIY